MNAECARRRFAGAAVARLATADASARPHIVPVTFTLLGPDTIVSAVDHKPKRTLALKRLANIAANPAVSLLVDRYDDDWSALWWVRADGRARVLAAPGEDPGTAADPDGGLHAAALAALARRYEQYRATPPTGHVIVIEVQRWSAWEAVARGR